MIAETIFSIANLIALVGWILLMVAPKFVVTRTLIIKGWLPVIFGLAYLCIIVAFFGKADGGFDSLPNVMKLFSDKWVVLAGWLHYLAFDLFVGTWEVRDAQQRGISHWFVIPCLIFTFMLGPIGMLMYYGVRLIKQKEVTADAL